MKNRDAKIDFIRGIAIIFMVMGHACAPGSSVIALFNIPIFFMISGYLFDPLSVTDKSGLFRFYARKIKSLWWTYFSWNTIFVLLNNFFIKIHIYTDNTEIENVYGICNSLNNYMSLKEMLIAIAKGFFMLGSGTKMGGAFWFLTVLFGVSLAYATIEYLIGKSKTGNKYARELQAVVSLSLLGIGYGLSGKGYMIYGLSPCFSAYILFYMGNCIKLVEEKCKNKKPFYMYIIMGVISGGLLLFMNQIGSVSLGNNRYENPLFLLMASLLGWIMLSALSNLFAETKIGIGIEVLGANSLIIMVFHFLSFKLVSLVGVILQNKPLYLIAAFPVLYCDGWVWIFYTIVGVGLPVLLKNGVGMVRRKNYARIKK